MQNRLRKKILGESINESQCKSLNNKRLSFRSLPKNFFSKKNLNVILSIDSASRKLPCMYVCMYVTMSFKKTRLLNDKDSNDKKLTENATSDQGCQTVCFQTENPNLGKFWRVLQWKMLEYVMDTCSILRSLA
jgi:hypothetical protein